MKAQLLNHAIVEDTVDPKAVEAVAVNTRLAIDKALPWATVTEHYETASMQHVVRAAVKLNLNMNYAVSEHTLGTPDMLALTADDMRRSFLSALEREPAVQALIQERNWISRQKVAQIAQLIGGVAAVQLLELVHNLKD